MNPKNRKRIKNLVLVVLMGAFILFWFFILIIIGAEEFVSYIGIEESYASLFIISLIGAFTSLTTFSAYPALVTFITGGLSPIPTTLVAATGLILGDLCFFLFGRNIRQLLSKKAVEKLKAHIDLENRYVPIIIYIYVAFTPFPNNILTAWLAIENYPLKRLRTPLILGDITLPLLVTFATKAGIMIF